MAFEALQSVLFVSILNWSTTRWRYAGETAKVVGRGRLIVGRAMVVRRDFSGTDEEQLGLVRMYVAQEKRKRLFKEGPHGTHTDSMILYGDWSSIDITNPFSGFPPAAGDCIVIVKACSACYPKLEPVCAGALTSTCTYPRLVLLHCCTWND
jgi:hypothetical protein